MFKKLLTFINKGFITLVKWVVVGCIWMITLPFRVPALIVLGLMFLWAWGVGDKWGIEYRGKEWIQIAKGAIIYD